MNRQTKLSTMNANGLVVFGLGVDGRFHDDANSLRVRWFATSRAYVAATDYSRPAPLFGQVLVDRLAITPRMEKERSELRTGEMAPS